MSRSAWRFVAAACISLLVVAANGAASAAGDESHGVSMVSEVDVSRGRIVLDEVEYRVTDTTRIQRFNGVVASLAEIRVPHRRPGVLQPAHEVDYVRFEARSIRGGWEMVSMTILAEPVQ